MSDSDDNSKPSFKCRDSICSKVFTDQSNRNRHEKRAGHSHNPRGHTVRPTKVGKLFKCTTCEYKSELKKNVVRHIKNGCPDIRNERNNNKECPICQ